MGSRSRSFKFPKNAAASFIAAYLLYYLFTGKATVDEAILGVLFAVATTAFAALTWRASRLHFSPALSETFQVWRLPWYIVCDSWTLVAVLAKDLAGVRPAGSYLRTAHFDRCTDLPRTVLATTYTSISPNSIVIGIDPDSHVLVYHQLAKGELTRMIRNLGALP